MSWNYLGVEQFPYGDTTTYEIGMDLLKDCSTICDWGCGTAYAQRYIKPGQTYTGVDFTPSKFNHITADLRWLQHKSEGIFMRHVLEHNFEWKEILKNALASFTKRFVLIMFTILVPKTQVIYMNWPTIPTMAFSATDLHGTIEETHKIVSIGQYTTKTEFGHERIMVIEPK